MNEFVNEFVYVAGSGNPIGVKLEKRPEVLKIAPINQVGQSIARELEGLGFRVGLLLSTGAILPDGLVLMRTPKTLLGKQWALSHQQPPKDQEQDPNLFTIHLHHPEVGYVDFLRQIRGPEGDYRVFIP